MIILGAGECGVRSAFALRDKGYVDRITLIGAEPVLPYERPPLSKSVSAEPRPIRSKESYREADIDLRLGVHATRVDTADKYVELSGGTRLPYHKLLLATGAHARLFPGMEGCLTLRTLKDAYRIIPGFVQGKHVGIIGGGFIGLELAATARLCGCDVTVIEAAAQLMARAVPKEIATVIQRRHQSEGVTVMTNARVVSATAETIVLGDGKHRTFDLVIAGVGALPDTALAEAAGIRVDNGILVDSAFRTSAPDVFAAGDCCNFPWHGRQVRVESWRAAQDQGEHAAAAMLGEIEDYNRVPWFWSDQYDLTLQVAGLFDPLRKTLRRPVSNDAFLVLQTDDAGHLMAAAGVGPGNLIAKSVRLAEKLIERQVPLDAGLLCDPAVDLKSLLKAT